jgi:hypothetical protein
MVGKLKKLVAGVSLNREMLQHVIRRSYEACSASAASRSRTIDLEGLDPSRMALLL